MFNRSLLYYMTPVGAVMAYTCECVYGWRCPNSYTTITTFHFYYGTDTSNMSQVTHEAVIAHTHLRMHEHAAPQLRVTHGHRRQGRGIRAPATPHEWRMPPHGAGRSLHAAAHHRHQHRRNVWYNVRSISGQMVRHTYRQAPAYRHIGEAPCACI